MWIEVLLVIWVVIKQEASIASGKSSFRENLLHNMRNMIVCCMEGIGFRC